MFSRYQLMLERAQSYQLVRTPATSRTSSPTNEKQGTIAFAFDIDGVIMRSKTPVPGASEAIAILQEMKIPFIFLTNGGGKTEKDHVALLIPFRDLVPESKDKNILVLGGTGDNMRNVARDYGFRHVYTTSDIYKSFPHIYPFDELTAEYHQKNGRQVKLNAHGQLQISSILIWSSPRDWGMDLQLILDLLLSHQGCLNTISSLNGDKSLPNRGYGQDSQPSIHWCNPDLTWATSHELPRLAQGSFRAALQGIWLAQTGLDHIPNETTVGKPTKATFLYGEKTLVNYNHKLNGHDAPHIDTVYMIGDNPKSDILGANSFESPRGLEWKSILVESGVYVAGIKPAHTPTHIAVDVLQAVKIAIEEGTSGKGVSTLSKSSTLVDLTELAMEE